MEAAANALQYVEAHQYDDVIPLPNLGNAPNLIDLTVAVENGDETAPA